MAIFIKTGTGFYEAESVALSSDKSMQDLLGDALPDISYDIEPEDDFADDAAAATGGVAVGGLYHTEGVVKIRLT